MTALKQFDPYLLDRMLKVLELLGKDRVLCVLMRSRSNRTLETITETGKVLGGKFTITLEFDGRSDRD